MARRDTRRAVPRESRGSDAGAESSRSGRRGTREPRATAASTQTPIMAGKADVVSLLNNFLVRPRISIVGGTVVLAAFVVFLILQHRMVFPYHDDWGLAVLDYGVVVSGFEGRSFSVVQAIDFFSQMYMQWSGRVVPFFVQAFVFKGGVDAVRVFQIAVIVCVVLLAARLGSAGRAISWILAVPIVLYLAVPLFVAARGLYWYSASSHSLWGVPILFLGAVLAVRSVAITPPAAAAMAIAALFNEMMSAAVLALLGTLIIAQLARGVAWRPLAWQAVLCVPAVLAGGFVVLAPGNFVRVGQSEYRAEGPVGIALANFARVAELVTQHQSARPFLLLWAMAVALLVMRIFLSRGFRIGLASAIASMTVLVLGFSLAGPWALGAIWIVHVGLVLLLRMQAGAVIALGLLMGAAASVLPVLASPVIYPRSMINLYVFLFPPIAWAVGITASSGPRVSLVVLGVFIAAAIPAMGNARDVYRGYAQSLPFHAANERALQLASEEAAGGKSALLSVRLYMLPTVRYSEVMPYQKPAIETWIKKYYGLSPATQFDYRPPQELPSTGGR